MARSVGITAVCGRASGKASFCKLYMHPLKVCSRLVAATVVIEIVATLLKLRLLVPMSSLEQAVVKVD